LPPRCTKPKEKISPGLTETAIKKIFSDIGLVHPYYIKLKIGWEANLLLSSKNVVVGSPKNVVGGLRSDQKNVEETSPYPSENVVSGLETQWAALYAARQMIHEESLCIVLVWLYDQARIYFESQA